MTTSREFLALEGEQVFQVRPLDPMGAGADLLQARARAVGVEIAGADRELAEAICERLDGLPLAIEIAATRAGTLGLDALLASLEDSFTLLAAGQRRGIARQQTMRKAIDWSYQLLTPDEQRLFRMLGIFRGGFELDAAADVANRLGYAEPRGSAAGLGSGLPKHDRRKSAARPSPVTGSLNRCAHSLSKPLQILGKCESVAHAHAAWIAGLTDIPIDGYYSRACHEVAFRLERELDNFRAALELAHDCEEQRPRAPALRCTDMHSDAEPSPAGRRRHQARPAARSR